MQLPTGMINQDLNAYFFADQVFNIWTTMKKVKCRNTL